MSKNNQNIDKVSSTPEVQIFYDQKQNSILLSGYIYKRSFDNIIAFTRKDGSPAGYVTKDKNKIINTSIVTC